VSTGSESCAAGSLTEVEPNDTAATANVIPGATSTFCGRLPSVGDVDYITFTLPANAKTVWFGRAWDKAVIGVEVSVDGGTFTVGSPPIFKPGSTYVMKVWIKGPGTATNYTVSVATE
jgi:hypothetical protein